FITMIQAEPFLDINTFASFLDAEIGYNIEGNFLKFLLIMITVSLIGTIHILLLQGLGRGVLKLGWFLMNFSKLLEQAMHMYYATFTIYYRTSEKGDVRNFEQKIWLFVNDKEPYKVGKPTYAHDPKGNQIYDIIKIEKKIINSL
ncbi:MAG: hypothetical protein AAFU33_10905, partial [Bacteroidota bacterium]